MTSNLIKVVNAHEIVKCNNCDLVYLKEYPNTLFNFIQDSTSENDNGVEFWSFPNLYKKHQSVFDNFFKQRISRINKYAQYQEKSYLDIGIGFGLWAKYLETNGYTGIGFDVSIDAINYCKSLSLNAEHNSLEDFNSDKKFDLICMFDVLEHLEDPQKMLHKIKSSMNPNSLLYIQVPNVLGIKFPYNHSLGLPYHLWQFNPKSLKKLLIKSGFEVQEYWTGIQGVIGHYEKGGPSKITKTLWKIANILKIGNRIQIIVKIKQ
jgi:2-polyprenyl-3-methyl-5-hydroxy-6-metoxy-1,4-benzoquinol methylase